LEILGSEPVMAAVGQNMTTTVRIAIIRLLTATVIALAACIFVCFYSSAAGLDHEQTFGRDVPLPFLTRCVVECRPYAFAVPVLALCIGAALLWRRPDPQVAVELLVAFTSIAAFAWPLFAIWVWRLAMIKFI
jgi:hypothetical protein